MGMKKRKMKERTKREVKKENEKERRIKKERRKKNIKWNYIEFSLTSCPSKMKEPSLPYFLPIVGGRIVGSIPFLKYYVKCKQACPGF